MERIGPLEILIIVGIILGLFLAFRNVQLWYYKVNERIKLQKESIQVQKEIVTKLNYIFEKLIINSSFEEQEKIYLNTLQRNLNYGQAIIKHKESGTISVVTTKEWNKLISKDPDAYEIIEEK